MNISYVRPKLTRPWEVGGVGGKNTILFWKIGAHTLLIWGKNWGGDTAQN